MGNILIFLILVVIVLILIKKSKQKEQPETINENLPYVFKNILTNEEYKFYLVLKQITNEQRNLICPKVGLKDIANVTDKDNYMKWFGKISQKHVDFIICDENLKVLYAIELDDPSHNTPKAKEKDKFKNEFFEKINIPLIRIETGKYDKEEIKIKILDNMKRLSKEVVKENNIS